MNTSKADKSKEFFNNPDNYIASNVIIELRQKVISDYLGDVSNQEIIDIGCGDGSISKKFAAENRVTFLDISPNMIELAKKSIRSENQRNCTFINSKLEDFQSVMKYDIIICLGVIAHVESISSLLRILAKLSADNGIIIIQFTAAEKIIAKFNRIRAGKNKNYKYNINYTTSSEIRSHLGTAGLNIIKEIKYIPVSPLLSIFSYKTKLNILQRFINGKIFDKIGSEQILFLKK